MMTDYLSRIQVELLVAAVIFLSLAPAPIALAADANPYLRDNENLVFEFMTKKGKMLCVAMDKKEAYIVYRYGKPGHVEFEYPADKDKERSYVLFTYAYYMRGGGPENGAMDLNYLTFTNGDYQYRVYITYSSGYADDEKTEISDRNVGVKVRNRRTSKEFDIKGDVSTLKGSMLDLRFNSKVKSTEAGENW